jgi:NADH:ubiquinone reductase (H+-translocating)
MTDLHKVVVVGGGAGGLELVTKLGDTLGKKKQALITLVDKNRTHIWKPKLHEIASGSMDSGEHELDYIAQAHWHHFQFRIGAMQGLDRAAKTITIAPYTDENGRQVTPEQIVPYDTLIICVGSLSNDFGTPGVKEKAFLLENQIDAKKFHANLINACIRAHYQPDSIRQGQLHVAIIGAGATGVELAAQLYRSTRELVSYGLDRINPKEDLQITVIEAAPRILPALAQDLSLATQQLLEELGVRVLTQAKVCEVSDQGVLLADGRFLDSELVVWAAGVKAADYLKEIAGLETNRLNQLVVHQTLQTTRDEHIFAFGDCSSCPWPQANQGVGGFVPPRAQAAHQQASHMYGQIKRRLAGQALKPYHYKDFGSLVSLGKFRTVGSMMGGIIGDHFMVQGFFARFMYLSLYKMHELAIHGFSKVFLDTVARLINRRTEPHVKLH